MGGDEKIWDMDAQLNEHTILVFRKLAHAKVIILSSWCCRCLIITLCTTWHAHVGLTCNLYREPTILFPCFGLWG